MRPFFLVLVLMVAASLLMAVAAVARSLWLRVRPAGATKPDFGHSRIYTRKEWVKVFDL
jgi:hypothetical protein